MSHSSAAEDKSGGEWQGEFDPLCEAGERRALFSVLDSFRQYRRTAHRNTTHSRRQAFYALPQAHWQALAAPPISFLDTLEQVDDAIDANADVAELILATGLAAFDLPANPAADCGQLNWHDKATASDLQKAHSTVRQFYRDWSAEGASERAACYGPVLDDLRAEWGATPPEGTRVLVPGAGLGRLVFELCLAGYDTEGNELSYHQLLASSWVLNHTVGPAAHAVFPFATQFSNLKAREHQLRRVMIPDVHPATEMGRQMATGDRQVGSMSMSAADFLVLYSGPTYSEAYDAVTTVFFIDTAPNIIRYIATIHGCLKPGGLWINVGPLLWHTRDDRADEGAVDVTTQTESVSCADRRAGGIDEPGQVELTETEVLHLVSTMGFTIEMRDAVVRESGYIQNPDAMLQNTYRSSHWIARKQR
ncbi:hypothetical protein KEM52_005870 [Ascosphaera acerosa]|nr:hypothetical protein KEM52_005870 [Ascosphaera acerosa]